MLRGSERSIDSVCLRCSSVNAEAAAVSAIGARVKSSYHRDARDERVVLDGVAQLLDRRAHDIGQEAARVDHRVPAPAVERGEILRAIAAEVLDLGVQLGVRAAVEEP